MEPRRPSVDRPPAGAHVLVVGAGGIGCPAAWALRRAGVGRLTILDPDEVELSNLPRQVLFTPADVGRPKAVAAAERLGGEAAGVIAEAARLDDTNEAAHLADGVDVLLDATDGAPTKDWLNQLAVRRGIPLVHAAGLRSEGRLLIVPAGGAPCLACLFGRLEEETGSCADLGVWNGVVGAVGLLAARAALALLRAPTAAGPGYLVLDFEAGRHMVLGAPADPACPVCAPTRMRTRPVEPYPATAACATPETTSEAGPAVVREVLDLRRERCPFNLLWARRALAAAAEGELVDIHLGDEGAATVPDGVRALGHEIVVREPRPPGLFLRVRAGGRGKAAAHERLDEHALQRFARQVVLPEVGEAGQRRLLDASVRLAGSGRGYEIAALYLAAGGVGRLELVRPAEDLATDVRARSLGTVESVEAGAPSDVDLVAWAGDGGPPDAVPAGRSTPALVVSGDATSLSLREDWARPYVAEPERGGAPAVAGALLADAVQRRLVLGRSPLAGVALEGLLG